MSALEDFVRAPTPTSRPAARGAARSSSLRGGKARAAALDFLDLLLRARDLLRDHADVRAEFQRRFTHLFVDEFQDTDPLQAEILLLLAADDRRRDALARRCGRSRASCSSSATRSSRSTASAAPTSALRGGAASSCAARGAACVALTHAASAPCRTSSSGERRVRAAHDGRPAARQAGYVPLAPVRRAAGQPALIALPVP